MLIKEAIGIGRKYGVGGLMSKEALDTLITFAQEHSQPITDKDRVEAIATIERMIEARNKLAIAEPIFISHFDLPKYQTTLSALRNEYATADYGKVCETCGKAAYRVSKQVGEKEIYNTIYNIERKTCASEKCEKTCPAYTENKEYPCGVKLRTMELATAIKELMEGK